MALLELDGISKNFGAIQALQGIDLTLEPGEVLLRRSEKPHLVLRCPADTDASEFDLVAFYRRLGSREEE